MVPGSCCASWKLIPDEACDIFPKPMPWGICSTSSQEVRATSPHRLISSPDSGDFGFPSKILQFLPLRVIVVPAILRRCGGLWPSPISRASPCALATASRHPRLRPQMASGIRLGIGEGLPMSGSSRASEGCVSTSRGVSAAWRAGASRISGLACVPRTRICPPGLTCASDASAIVERPHRACRLRFSATGAAEPAREDGSVGGGSAWDAPRPASESRDAGALGRRSSFRSVQRRSRSKPTRRVVCASGVLGDHTGEDFLMPCDSVARVVPGALLGGRPLPLLQGAQWVTRPALGQHGRQVRRPSVRQLPGPSDQRMPRGARPAMCAERQAFAPRAFAAGPAAGTRRSISPPIGSRGGEGRQRLQASPGPLVAQDGKPGRTNARHREAVHRRVWCPGIGGPAAARSAARRRRSGHTCTHARAYALACAHRQTHVFTRDVKGRCLLSDSRRQAFPIRFARAVLAHWGEAEVRLGAEGRHRGS